MLRLIKGTKAPIGSVLVGLGGGGGRQREVKGSRELAWRELCLAFIYLQKTLYTVQLKKGFMTAEQNLPEHANGKSDSASKSFALLQAFCQRQLSSSLSSLCGDLIKSTERGGTMKPSFELINSINF
jgi:hypothetical protein